MKKKSELILEVGGAGGSISLWSVIDKDSSRGFIITTDESTLKQLLDEEDAKGFIFKSNTELLHSFDDALVALGKYPWYLLKLLFVHQDFIDPILVAAKKLRKKQKDEFWRKRSLIFIDELNSKKAAINKLTS